MTPIQWTLIKYGTILLALAALGGYVYYQDYVINSQKSTIETLNTTVETLETKVTSINATVAKFQKNQSELREKQEELQGSISRFGQIATKKPTLLARKIERSYNTFHLEKSCFSGNEEACSELKKLSTNK